MGMKLAFMPDSPSCFLSTHDDGRVRLFDLRAARDPLSPTHGVLARLARASGNASDLAFDPGAPHIFALGCNDPMVRLYDTRRMPADAPGACLANLLPPPVAAMVRRGGPASRHLEGVSGLAWTKGHLLATSYRGADIFTMRCGDVTAVPYVRSFAGRRNVRTFLKGVTFLCGGEYLVAGGDCGGCFVWHTESGQLACRLQADMQVLNSVAAHPAGLPFLAVSGIDEDVKLI